MASARTLGVLLAGLLTGCTVVAESGSDLPPTVATTAPASLVTTTEPPPITEVAPTTEAVAESAETSDAASSTAATTTSPTTTTIPPDPPPPNADFEGVQLAASLVADVEAPTALAWRQDDPAMYVGTQAGQVFRVADGGLEAVLDLSAETIELLPGSERGLLGLAFDPRDGRMFVDITGLDDNTRVLSFEMRDGAVVQGSRREVLFIEQPGVGHNGGRLVFDDDGNLYVASGDGGGSNGRDAQDPTKLLGAILRIRPRLDGEGYDIPEDNPFADGVGERPEVWARGLRNPWGFSIDDETGDLWIGDVGNESREEVNVIRAGESGLNFGWYYYEGTLQRVSDAPEGLTPPVYDYPRSDGVAVMGGHVYRGSAIPQLRGAYLFADLGGPVWAIGADGVTRLAVDQINGIVGWGEDPDGELYVMSIYDGVFQLAPA